MKLRKKAILLAVLLICIYAISILSQSFENAIPSSTNVYNLPTIILDAGHGGLTNTTH